LLSLFPARLGPPKQFNLPLYRSLFRIAVQPQISTVHCKTLNNLIRTCYSLPVVAAMKPRRLLNSFSRAGRRLPWSYLQTGTLPRPISFACHSYVDCRVCTQNSRSGTHPPASFPSHSPYPLPSSVSYKSFNCHSYENTRGVGVFFPFWNSPHPARGYRNVPTFQHSNVQTFKCFGEGTSCRLTAY
jgi:hypothetical protein